MFSTLRSVLWAELEAPKATTTFGQGWISGVAALVFACIGFFSVILLHYPDIFTVPDIRNAVNVNLFRVAVQVILVIGFILACISLILRQNKAIGLAAISLIISAVMMGGSAAQATAFPGKLYFGLDWFMLNLLITGILFLPMERLFRRVDQSVFRFEWREDLFYFLISSIMVQSLTFLSMIPATTILAHSNLHTIQTFVASQPLWLQIFEIMFLTDFVQYWVHRLFHQVPFLWGFHAVHHSTQAMDWLAGSRMHLVEIVCLRSVTIVPMYVLGFQESAIYAYIIFVYLYATYIHANLKFDIEWLKPVIVTARFHHWHHGIEKEAIDVNFAIHFPIFDRVFGTYYMPRSQWPSGYGIGGNPVPSGFMQQFMYPFERRKTK